MPKQSFNLLSGRWGTNLPENTNEIVTWARSVKWIRLEILNVTGGKENNSEGSVEFKAYFEER